MAHPDPSLRRALFNRPATATSSAGTAESRSRPRNLAVRCNEPSLLRTTPSLTSAAQGRKSANRVAVERYSARFIMCLSSNGQGTGDAAMTADHVDKEWVALRSPDRRCVTDRPEQDAS